MCAEGCSADLQERSVSLPCARWMLSSEKAQNCDVRDLMTEYDQWLVVVRFPAAVQCALLR